MERFFDVVKLYHLYLRIVFIEFPILPFPIPISQSMYRLSKNHNLPTFSNFWPWRKKIGEVRQVMKYSDDFQRMLKPT